MNRRVFCSALAAWACGGHRPSRTKRRRRSARREPGPKDDLIVHRIPFWLYNNIPIWGAVYGDLYIDSKDGVLRTWDLIATKQLSTVAISHVSTCFAQDGTLAVLAVPPGSDHCVLHRVNVQSGAVLRTFQGPRYDERTDLLPARAPDEYYGARDRELVLFRTDRGQLLEAARVPIPEEGLLYDSTGDGRVVMARYRLHVLEAGQPTRSFPLPHRWLHHLVAATGDRCWYTFASDDGERIDTLALAHLTNPAIEEQRIVFPPDQHVAHIAPGGDAVAVLLFSPILKAATPEEGLRWWVVLIGEDGKERWRVPVPPAYTGGSLRLSDSGAVAVSTHRVILNDFADTFLVWDRATGATIPWPDDQDRP